MTCRLRWCGWNRNQLSNSNMANVWANSMARHLRSTYHTSSQIHISHCRVLPLGEFTVTIPEPHATLQCVRIPSAILKIVFCHILLFLFLMHFRLWRAAAFVSSPIHLLYEDRSYKITDRKHCIGYRTARRQSFIPQAHRTFCALSMPNQMKLVKNVCRVEYVLCATPLYGVGYVLPLQGSDICQACSCSSAEACWT